MATVVFADLVGSTGIFERLGDETAGRFVTQLTTALSPRSSNSTTAAWSSCSATASSSSSPTKPGRHRLHRHPGAPEGQAGLPRRHRQPVQMQMGVESGEVVEIEGDCYGDAVNSAARLADLAGADQILTTQRVRDALAPEQQRKLRSLGPMYLRGKPKRPRCSASTGSPSATSTPP
jgi:adenylate cyclase